MVFPLLLDKRGAGIDDGEGGGAAWEDVTAPDAAFSFVPFTIQRNGRTFRPDPTFNLQTYANITVAKTYYVDKSTGNNANTGLDWDNALADLKTARGKADVDRIYIRNGYYFLNECIPVPARSVETIGAGSAQITSDFRNEIGVFSAVDNHYEATISGGRAASLVVDTTNLGAFGGPSKLTLKASAAEVDANANSWWQSGTTIYIRTFDDRVPDASIRYLTALAISHANDNLTLYYENLEAIGAVQVRNSTSAGGMKTYFKDCSAVAWAVQGADEAIFQNCISFQAVADGFNYDIRNTISPKVVEIDCESYNNGAAASDQASTSHAGCAIVRINGKYHDCSGQCIADVNGGNMTWCLGSELYNSAAGIGLNKSTTSTAATSWLDRCHSHDNDTYDLQVGASTTVYIREFIGELGINSVNGTLEEY